MFEKIKMGPKLIGAFCVVTVITAIVGLVGYNSTMTTMGYLDEIGEENLPAVQALLTISEAQTAVDSDERALLSAKITGDRRDGIYSDLQEAWAEIDENWATYEPLPRIKEADVLWKELAPKWAIWKGNHQEFIKMAKELDETHILDPMELKLDLTTIKADHIDWILALSDSVAEVEPFEKELDPTKCGLGVWLSEYKTANEELNKGMIEIQPPHNRIHVAGTNIMKILNGSGDKEEKSKAMMAIFDKEILLGGKDEIYAGFESMLAIADISDQISDKLVHQGLTINHESFNEAMSLMDQIILITEEDAKHMIEESDEAVGSATTTLVTAIIFGIIIALTLGIFFARNIVKIITGLLEESKMLTDAVESGNLGIRGNVEKINKEFRGIVQGMNDTVDAFVKPITTVSDYVARIGAGNIPPAITDTYNGDFNDIKNSLNACIGAV
ncbi:MCP four helix bundle domain-containing protein, partial [Thermodesulfobacteriota bacterium]